MEIPHSTPSEQRIPHCAHVYAHIISHVIRSVEHSADRQVRCATRLGLGQVNLDLSSSHLVTVPTSGFYCVFYDVEYVP